MITTTVSIIVAFISLVGIALIGIRTNLLKESNGNDNPYSFSRFQLWIWSLVIIPAFSLHWGFNDNVWINDSSLVLLGISAGIGVSAGFIRGVQLNSSNRPKKLKNEQKHRNFFSDILMDDNGQLSVVRLQQLFFTFTYLVIYIALFFKSGMRYPDFDPNAYVLMGISGGTYLLGKGVYK